MASPKMSHKIRARTKDGTAEVKVPRQFIRELTCEHNGKAVLTAQWSWGIATNPYLSFRVRDASPGDRIRLFWIDDKGKTDQVDAVVA